jgi:redox-sensitive bicupin YhaK (pirin superfamily)
LPFASGQGIPNTVTFHTDATLYRCDLDAGKSVSFEGTHGRRIFIYLTSGELSLNGEPLTEKEQARIDIDETLTIEAASDAEFILIDVPSCKGYGYSEKTLSGSKK